MVLTALKESFHIWIKLKHEVFQVMLEILTFDEREAEYLDVKRSASENSESCLIYNLHKIVDAEVHLRKFIDTEDDESTHVYRIIDCDEIE
jgi:hypothetical protein